MKTFRDLIEKFGGPRMFSLLTGINRNSVNSMYVRNSVNSDYWPALVSIANKEGIEGVTIESIAALRRGNIKPMGRRGARFQEIA